MPELLILPLSKAKALIQEGDVLLYRGESIASFFLGRAAESIYTHCGVASWHNNIKSPYALLECVEFKEWVGGRSVNLEVLVKDDPGIIDVYRHAPKIWKPFVDTTNTVRYKRLNFNGRLVTQTMRLMTGLPYGWERIWWITLHKLSLTRLFYDMENLVSDVLQEVVYPVCSTALAYSFSKHGYDLVKNRADEWTEPGDVARSPYLTYLFTLVP